LDTAITFFEGVLGFTKYIHFGTYAYLERERCGIRLMQNVGDDGAPAGNRRLAYYIDVEDIEALHAELKPKLDAMPPGDVHGPADKPYGQRELCILAPDGNLVVFGQTIDS
jgi:hypothetical protein